MSHIPEGTVHDAARRATSAFEAAGWTPDDARLDAEVIARAILGWDAAAWLVHRHDAVPPVFGSLYDTAVTRRLAHEPVAYIVGRREFYGRPFHVTGDVLIPRPETELVIDEALAVLPAARADQVAPLEAADVGTGSGCLAVTLALERPDIRVTATDTSVAAIAVATDNAATLGAGERVRFVHASLVGRAAPDSYDLIVANPPYVRDADRAGLMPDVANYEPASALCGGPDGLDVIRALLPAAAHALKPGGWLVMEMGAGQAPEVTRLLGEGTHLSLVRISKDLAGIPRVLVAQRPAH
jgi:release factor glutamine methyltransferase